MSRNIRTDYRKQLSKKPRYVTILVAAVLLAWLLAALGPGTGRAQLSRTSWNAVYALVKDGPVLWAGTGVGIERIDLNTGASERTILNHAFENRPRRILARAGFVWVARRFDVLGVDTARNRRFSIDLRQKQEIISGIDSDDDNTWLLTSERVLRFDHTLRLWQEFHAFDPSIPDHDFRAITSDGNLLWLGEADGNLCYLDKAEARFKCPLPAGRVPYHPWEGRIVAAAGAVWFAHRNTLYSYRPGDNELAAYTAPQTERDPGRINSLWRAAGGALWYTTHRSIGTFDPAAGEWHVVLAAADAQDLHIAGERGAGFILFTSRGLAAFEPSNPGLSFLDTSALMREEYDPETAVVNDEIWMGFPSGRVARFDPASGSITEFAPACAMADIIEKNLEGLASAQMALSQTMERLAVTRLEISGDTLRAASHFGMAVRDSGLWNVRRFETRTDAYYLPPNMALASSGGAVYVCAAGDAACTPPEKIIPLRGKTNSRPTAVLRYGNNLILPTVEGRVYARGLAGDRWSLLLDIPVRWKKPHPALAALAGDALYIGRDNHLFRARPRPGAAVALLTRRKPLTGTSVIRVCAPRAGTAVAVTDAALHVFRAGGFTEFPLPFGGAGVTATDCAAQPPFLWLAVSSLHNEPGVVFRMNIDTGDVSRFEIPASFSPIHGLAPEQDRVWLATTSGIAVLDAITGHVNRFRYKQN